MESINLNFFFDVSLQVLVHLLIALEFVSELSNVLFFIEMQCHDGGFVNLMLEVVVVVCGSGVKNFSVVIL